MLNHTFSKLKDQEFWVKYGWRPSAFQLFLFLQRRIIIKKGVKFDLQFRLCNFIWKIVLKGRRGPFKIGIKTTC